MVGLPAYLLGKQGVRDAMFLPVILKARIHIAVRDFKPKSAIWGKLWMEFFP
jgi:hypothetical protein